MNWGEVITRRASMKPIDEGGWDVFITYGGGFDFADPAMLICDGGQREEGLVRLAGERSLRRLRAQMGGGRVGAGQQPIAKQMQAARVDFVLMVMLGLGPSPRRCARTSMAS